MSKAVPEGWTIQALDGKVHILSGFPFKSSLFTDDSDFMGVIRIRDLEKQSIETFYAGDFEETYVVRRGDILIGMDGDFNIVKWNAKNALLNQRVCKVKADVDSSFDTEFLFQSLKDDLLSINAATGATTVKHLSVKDIRGIEKAYPPLPEQQKIANILSSVDDVIEKTRAQIDKLKDLKTGMMQELLTKGIGHTEFKDSPLGQVPEGWQLLSMRDICSVRQGLQIPISERHSKPSNNRWVYLTIRYINTGFDKSVAEYIENPKSSVVCTEDDIILARTGATGKVVTGISGVFHNNFFMVDYDRAKTVKNFLVQYLNSPFVQHEISNRAGTTTIPDLNHGDFYTIPMILPPVAEQLKLAEVLESLDILISNKISKYAAMEKAKKALMQDLLTGKVRVNLTDKESAVV